MSSDTQYKTPESRRLSHKQWVSKNKELVKEYGRIYRARMRADPELLEKHRKANRESMKRRREKLSEYDRNRDKQKTNARALVRNRIARGTLVRQPCEKCGEKNAQAHHDDYSKPLEIRWLCPVHHKEVHRVG